MKVKVDVSRHDIRHGRMVDPSDCAMARAIGRAVPLAQDANISVGHYSLKHVLDEHFGEVVDFPREVADFIMKLLGRNKLERWFIKPRSFIIDVPDRYMGAGTVEPEEGRICELNVFDPL